jgi:hypothetical protein
MSDFNDGSLKESAPSHLQQNKSQLTLSSSIEDGRTKPEHVKYNGDYKSLIKERREVLQSVEDTLPRVVEIMEAANIRINGFSVAGQVANELSQSWGTRDSFGKKYP